MSKLLIIDRGSTPDLFIKTDVTPEQEAAIEYYLSGGNPLPTPLPQFKAGVVVATGGVALRDINNVKIGGVWTGATLAILDLTADQNWYTILCHVTADPLLVKHIS